MGPRPLRLNPGEGYNSPLASRGGAEPVNDFETLTIAIY